MIKVLHIWEKYLPGLFDETHPYGLEKNPEGSVLLAARFVDSGGEPLPATFSMEVQERRITTNPTVLERIRLRLNETFFWARFNRFCKQKFDETKPDLIHIHFGNTAAKLLPFLSHVNVPVFVSFYGNDSGESIRKSEFKRLYPRLFEKVTRVVVLCEDVKKRLIEFGCAPEKLLIWIVPGGIEKYPYRERQPSETVRLIECARFVEKKGYHHLLEAFDQLSAKGYPLSLTIMGYGPLKKTFEKRGITEFSSPIKLIDTQLAPDFSSFYRDVLQEHDIFVLPSLVAANGDDEGGPALTMVCAQASGLPVVCSNFPGSELSIEDGLSGLVCEQDSVPSLVEKLEALITHPEWWNTMGKRGSEKVHKVFSRVTQMEELWGAYTRSVEEFRASLPLVQDPRLQESPSR